MIIPISNSNEFIQKDTVVWIKYNTKIGQKYCGDYGYVKCYAPNRTEVILNGETYVKGVVSYVAYCRGVKFIIKIAELYEVRIDEVERIFITD